MAKKNSANSSMNRKKKAAKKPAKKAVTKKPPKKQSATRKMPIASTLYYYCSVDTFVRMVSNKEIWLTNIQYFEDQQEDAFFKQMVLKEARKRPAAIKDDILRKLKEYVTNNAMSYTYCMCFSKKGDMLSQWKSFGDDGKGVSLGFNSDYLRKLRNNTSHHSIQLVNVQYKKTEQRQTAKQMVDALMTEPDDDFAKKVQQPFTHWRIGEYAVFCKNPLFHTEKEVRLVLKHFPHPEAEPDDEEMKIHYRVRSDNQVIPYVKIPLEIDAKSRLFDEIICGPKWMNNKKNIAAIRSMLRWNGFDDRFKIRKSKLKLK